MAPCAAQPANALGKRVWDRFADSLRPRSPFALQTRQVARLAVGHVRRLATSRTSAGGDRSVPDSCPVQAGAARTARQGRARWRVRRRGRRPVEGHEGAHVAARGARRVGRRRPALDGRGRYAAGQRCGDRNQRAPDMPDLASEVLVHKPSEVVAHAPGLIDRRLAVYIWGNGRRGPRPHRAPKNGAYRQRSKIVPRESLSAVADE